MRALARELRTLEAAYGAVEAYARESSDAGLAAAASNDAGVANGLTARQLALQLQSAQHEVVLLQDHLTAATERAKGLQLALEQRESDLQRTHLSLVEHMRQSGALLGSLASMHQNLAVAPTLQLGASPALAWGSAPCSVGSGSPGSAVSP